ncbi:hypothetical protein B0H94_1156 [Salsuginibacillus halophilus]|uniref:Uncharacterized protein n=1 Tax=Salsuginibacillus halophilus TaxID=517424 RepID=A0A2P8H845_9BACI|nr:hypothetical protein [Salsuginibacillus halophilus]PSL42403.1 hypothetical protein B0H94_1156 [Salsuginibacillus halophilus]
MSTETRTNYLECENKLFLPGQAVTFKDKPCTIIAEYNLSVTIEFLGYPYKGEEEAFPHPRTVVKKEKVKISTPA